MTEATFEDTLSQNYKKLMNEQMVVEKLDILMQKDEVGPLFYNIYKRINSKWIKT